MTFASTAPATPSAGHVPFVTVLRPSVPVQPPTLFVPKADRLLARTAPELGAYR